MIAEIGRIGADEADETIDADGLIVAPGFVDLHTHYDAQLFWDPYCTLSSWHGITSVVMWLAQYQQVYQMTWVGQHALYNVSARLFQHIAGLSLSFFDRNETGRVMARMQNDVTVLQATLSNGFISILGSVLSLGSIFVAMLILNWRLGLMVFSAVPVMAISLWLWQRRARRSFLAARAAISTVNASMSLRCASPACRVAMGGAAMASSPPNAAAAPRKTAVTMPGSHAVGTRSVTSRSHRVFRGERLSRGSSPEAVTASS